MKNGIRSCYEETMRERLLRKLKTIPTPTIWNPSLLAFQTSAFQCPPKLSIEAPSEEEQKVVFEERCPPGGNDTVVLYTTSLRGIRKTFEDGNTIRFLLDSFSVVYSERDVSMHLEYREELWKILQGRVVPPRLFIKGRYIGGADEVVGLHENGMLKNLLQGIPLTPSKNPCRGCGGMRFVVCGGCNGSRKLRPNQGAVIRCCDCNENGLLKCSICT